MMKIKQKLQHGFSLLTAIFLMVVLGGLGAMMVTLYTTQQHSSALDVLGSRAYQAAQAGIEWAAFGVSQTTVDSATAWSGCAAGTTFTPDTGTSLGGTLSPFTVVVTCTSESFVEGPTRTWIYNISASAMNGATPGSAAYVERVIKVKMAK